MVMVLGVSGKHIKYAWVYRFQFKKPTQIETYKQIW